MWLLAKIESKKNVRSFQVFVATTHFKFKVLVLKMKLSCVLQFPPALPDGAHFYLAEKYQLGENLGIRNPSRRRRG